MGKGKIHLCTFAIETFAIEMRQEICVLAKLRRPTQTQVHVCFPLNSSGTACFAPFWDRLVDLLTVGLHAS